MGAGRAGAGGVAAPPVTTPPPLPRSGAPRGVGMGLGMGGGARPHRPALTAAWPPLLPAHLRGRDAERGLRVRA